jgi:hypothetical protein
VSIASKRGEAEVPAEHGRGGQRLDGRRREPAEPAGDEVRDPLRQTRGLVGRLGEAAEHLLDEERVPGRAALETAGELAVADEYRRLGLEQPGERHAADELLAGEVGDQPRGRPAGLGLGVAQRHQHHEPRAVQPADDVAQEQERRAARPLEVLDDEQQAAARGGLGDQRRGGLEEPVTAVLALGGRVGGDVAAAQLGHERRQRVDVDRLPRPAGVRRVVAQRLHERLVRHDGLLVDAAVQHRRAVGARGGGGARGEAGLAHARLAGEHDDAARAGRRARPALAQLAQLALAADERARLEPRERGRQRHGGGRAGGRRLARGGGVALQQQALVQRGDVRGRRGPQLIA